MILFIFGLILIILFNKIYYMNTYKKLLVLFVLMVGAFGIVNQVYALTFYDIAQTKPDQGGYEKGDGNDGITINWNTSDYSPNDVPFLYAEVDFILRSTTYSGSCINNTLPQISISSPDANYGLPSGFSVEKQTIFNQVNNSATIERLKISVIDSNITLGLYNLKTNIKEIGPANCPPEEIASEFNVITPIYLGYTTVWDISTKVNYNDEHEILPFSPNNYYPNVQVRFGGTAISNSVDVTDGISSFPNLSASSIIDSIVKEFIYPNTVLRIHAKSDLVNNPLNFSNPLHKIKDPESAWQTFYFNGFSSALSPMNHIRELGLFSVKCDMCITAIPTPTTITEGSAQTFSVSKYNNEIVNLGTLASNRIKIYAGDCMTSTCSNPITLGTAYKFSVQSIVSGTTTGSVTIKANLGKGLINNEKYTFEIGSEDPNFNNNNYYPRAKALVTAYTVTPIQGQCSNPDTHYICAAGNSVNPFDYPTKWDWTCAGINGGTGATCSENKSINIVSASPASLSVEKNGVSKTSNVTAVINAEPGTIFYAFPSDIYLDVPPIDKRSDTLAILTVGAGTASVGSYTVTITASNSLNGVSDSISIPVTVQNPPAPDLTADAPTPITAVIGVTQTFTSKIWNHGDASTVNSFNNSFKVATKGDGEGTVTTSTTTPTLMTALGPTDRSTASATYTFANAQSPSNVRSIQFCADSNNAITNESNEGNNCSPWTNITIAYPDLTAGAVLYSSPVYAGNAKTFSAGISNLTSAGTIDDFEYKFQWRNDDHPLATDVPFPTSALSGLKGRVVYGSITFPTSGIYDVRACADLPPSPNGVIPEGTNEGNNCGPWTTVEVGEVPTFPDLTADVITPTTAYVGVSKVFSADIHNESGVGTGIGFKNFIQITDDPGTTTTAKNNNLFSTNKTQAAVSWPVSLPYVTMNALGPNGVGQTSQSYTFTTAGTYYIRACADKSNPADGGVINEGTTGGENNNCGSSVGIMNGYTPIIVTEQPFADLVASAVTPNKVMVGQNTFFATITNQGTGTTQKSFTNKFQVSEDPDFSKPTEYTITMPTLVAGKSDITSESILFEGEGIYYMRACADLPPYDYGVIDEGPSHQNEDNNCGDSTTVEVGGEVTAPIIHSPTADKIGNTYADLGATVASEGGYDVTIERGTCYSASSSEWIPSGSPSDNCSSAEAGTGTGIFSHKRSGLIPDTNYFYAGYATNYIGTSYTNVATFKTLNGTDPSGNLSATTCSIANNASTCESKVDWTTDNLSPSTSTAVTRDNPDNTLVGSGSSGTATSVVNFGDSVFYLYNNEVILDSQKINVGCVDGTYWNNDTEPGKCKTTPLTPYVTLTANPTSVVSGSSSTLKWTSGNTTSCLSDFFSGEGATSGSVLVSPIATTTYTMTCDNGVTGATDKAEVTVITTGPGPGGSGKTPGYIEN